MITSTTFCATPEKHYNLRNHNEFRVTFPRTVYCGTERIAYLRPKIWNFVPTEIKQGQSLNGFTRSIRKWVPNNCLCRLCKSM